jgi:catechol 2,3-dioxygenase-like lactoylglutathione lyase family enzyme
MSTASVRTNEAKISPSVATVDMKLEVVVIPVSDVERAKEFYQKLGWRLDVTPPGVVQLTPPGSGCSVQFGTGRTSEAPGSAQGLWLIVSDLQAALDKLATAGIKVDDVFHFDANRKASGLDPARGTYRSFASFSDPDGNKWLLQEITTRFPGRIDSGVTSYGSASDLANALRRAAAAHSEYEKPIGAADPNWPDWYAAYMAAEQAGTQLPK